MESDRGQEFQTNDLPGSSLPDAVQLMAHLLRLGETLSQHPHGVGERLSQEVMRITQGRAWLLLADQPILAEPDALHLPSSSCHLCSISEAMERYILLPTQPILPALRLPCPRLSS